MPTTLLAVDDSVTMRKVLEMTFAGEHDLRVVTADGVDSALAKFRSERAAIVLTDLSLDGAGGYGLCTRIKAESPSTPVIVLASKQQPYEPAKGQAAHADDFIEKPFDTQQLIDKVRKLLGRIAADPARPATGFQAAQPPAARSAYASTLVGQPIRQPIASGPRPSTPGAGAPVPPRTGAALLSPAAGQVPAVPRFGQAAVGAAHVPAGSGPTASAGGSTSSGLGPVAAIAGAGAAGATATTSAAASTPGGAPAHDPPPYRAPAPSTSGFTGRIASPAVTAAPAAAAAQPAHAPAASTAGGRAAGEAAATPVFAGPPATHLAVTSAAAALASASSAAATGANGGLAGRLADLGLNEAQVTAVLALSRDVVERVVWEVVPALAETMIREEIKRLTSEP